MTSGLRLVTALALCAALVAACGKYGPPRRMREATSPPGSAPAAQVSPAPLGREGTGILNPTTDDPASPSAPPEEPEEEDAP